MGWLEKPTGSTDGQAERMPVIFRNDGFGSVNLSKLDFNKWDLARSASPIYKIISFVENVKAEVTDDKLCWRGFFEGFMEGEIGILLREE